MGACAEKSYQNNKINYFALLLSIIRGINPDQAFDILEKTELTEKEKADIAASMRKRDYKNYEIADVIDSRKTRVSQLLRQYHPELIGSDRIDVDYFKQMYIKKYIENNGLGTKDINNDDDLPSYTWILKKYGGLEKLNKKLELE